MRSEANESATDGRPFGPAIVGEVLFDVFPDGEEVLGGAPFNVAWNLAGLGADPWFVSRVGEDARGRRILDAMERWGLRTGGVQRDAEHPTGIVRVELDRGEPSYTIDPGQAWDHVDARAAVAPLGEGDRFELVYFGTLAARSEPTARAIAHVVARTEGPVFVDLNLRDPWWSSQAIATALDAADVLKLSRGELDTIADVDAVDSVAAALRLATRHEIGQVVVTAGADGAIAVEPDGTVVERAAPEPERFVDAVGAGDAFASVWLMGLLGDWPVDVTLERAVAHAARICGIRGATTDAREPYRDSLDSWAAESE